MTLNDLERPIHLKVRLADGTLQRLTYVCNGMLWLSDLTMRDRTALFPVGPTIKSKMAASGHFENFKWPYFCNALSASLYVCTQTI